MENNTQTEIIEDTVSVISEAQTEETVSAEEASAEENVSDTPTPFDGEEFARQLLEVYPDADATDGRLLELAQSGTSLTPVEIYRAVNFEKLVKSAVKEATSKASKEAEARLIGHIRTSGMRPAENGTDRQRESRKTPPVTRLSRAERARIAARAGRGERIEF